MKPQLFVCETQLSPSLLKPVKNRLNWIKPGGGLWTSTYDEVNGSDWIQWCISEDFRITADGWSCYVLCPSPDARIYTINSFQDLEKFLAIYGYSDPSYHSLGPFPDFERIAIDFDGIHLTEEGQWATRLTAPGLYGWDCESTLWFRWIFDEGVNIGKQPFNLLIKEANNDKA